jgi:hypothetical protein
MNCRLDSDIAEMFTLLCAYLEVGLSARANALLNKNARFH